MASKNFLYVDRKTKAKMMSNITFQEESHFKAFENPTGGRELFISINEIAEVDMKLAKTLIEKALDESLVK